MKSFRNIIYSLGLCLAIAFALSLGVEGYAQKRKAKAKTTSTKTKASNATNSTKARSTKGTASKGNKATQTRNTRSSKGGRGTRSKVTRASRGSQRRYEYVDYAERREEKRRQDSLRLRIGGTAPIPRMGQRVEAIAQTEPLLLRFRRADSTLSMRTIESLYFTRQTAADDSLFFGQIIPKVDKAIEQGQYKDALTLAEKGLYRNPMHIGLLKRACDLAQHEGSEALDAYIWQISELFHLIQNTGDGKSPETAWRVMEMNDALLFENLWMGTEMINIFKRETTPYQGQSMLSLTVPSKKGRTEKHYYLIGKPKS